MERIILIGLGGCHYIVATPDFDVYDEDYVVTADSNIEAVRIMGPRFVKPDDLTAARVYRFGRIGKKAAQELADRAGFYEMELKEAAGALVAARSGGDKPKSSFTGADSDALSSGVVAPTAKASSGLHGASSAGGGAGTGGGAARPPPSTKTLASFLPPPGGIDGEPLDELPRAANGQWYVSESVGGAEIGAVWFPEGGEVFKRGPGPGLIGSRALAEDLSGVIVPLLWMPDVEVHEWLDRRRAEMIPGTVTPRQTGDGQAGGAAEFRARLSGALQDKPAGGDFKENARMMPLMEDSTGERYRDFRETARALEEHEQKEWPIQGPRTVRWLFRYIAKNGGTPMARHTKWMIEAKIDQTHTHAFIHEVISEFFELAVAYDQVECSNLACVERLARWYQDIEGAHEIAEPKGASDPYVSGTQRLGSGAAYCPELRQFVIDKMSRDSAIHKEKRKAQEERELARKKKG